MSFKRGLLYTISAFILLIICICSFTEHVDPGYSLIIQNKATGAITDHMTPGWKVINPFISKTAQYPISTEMIVLTKEETEGSDKNDSINVPTKEGQNVNVDISGAYKVTDPKKLYIKYRGIPLEEIREKIIRNILNNELMAVTGTYSILSVNDHRDEISKIVNERVKEKLKTEGIEWESFFLREVRLPQSVAASFAAKIDAENKIRQAESKRQEAEITAKTKLIKAEAEAKSNRIISESLTDKLITKMQIETINPKAQVIYIPTNTAIFLNNK
ncbi:MAG: SPFH domain-containing protein [Anaerovoracaceae bacterium]